MSQGLTLLGSLDVDQVGSGRASSDPQSPVDEDGLGGLPGFRICFVAQSG